MDKTKIILGVGILAALGVGVAVGIPIGMGRETKCVLTLPEPTLAKPGPSNASAQPVKKATWGQPVTTDHFTITLTEPVDTTDKYGGFDTKTADFDVTVTAGKEPLQLSEAVRFSGHDDNYATLGSTWISQVGEAVLPAGKTFEQRGVQLHFSDAAKTTNFVLWVDDLDGRHLVQWSKGMTE